MTTSLPSDFSVDNTEAMRRTFAAQRAASRNAAPSSAETRRAALDKLRVMITGNEQAIVDAISQDFGNRSRHETQIMEIVGALDTIAHAKKHVARWMKPEKRPTSMNFKPGRSWVRYEPLGVVGIISPWNYPLILALQPLADVLAAGNRAMIKPSELTPTFSALLQRLIAEQFAPEEVAVVTGGPETAEAFSALPFDHLVFTGSTATGRKVAQAAAANLTPVTLELGGKSPAIVCADYPLAKAAASIAQGKFINAGQTCIAPDYALVPTPHARAFAEAVLAKARKAYPTLAGNADYSSVISARHHARLKDAIDEAKASGAEILTHGADDGGDATRKIAPTVVLGAPKTCAVVREEIFGPVLPVVSYENLDTALAEIRAGDRPLALYCFTNDAATRDKVLDGALSGGATINGTILHVAQHALPFGGVGASGIGAYHGHEGFKRFSHARAVYKVGAFSGFEKMGPPWGRLAGMMIKMMKKG